MRKAIVSVRKYLLVLGLGLAGVTCAGDSTGPSGSHDASVRVRPVLSATALAAQVPLTQRRVVVVRAPAETLATASGAFTVADTATPIVAALELESEAESLIVTLELSTATGIAFRGRDTLEVVSASASAADPVTVPVEVRYVGTGANAALVRVTPRDSLLNAGDTLFFVVTGTDSTGGAIAAPYVLWSTTLAGAALQQTGRLIGPALRTSGFVRVLTPTGLVDSARVSFLPPPSEIAKQGGDLQTGEVGDTLALPLTVLVRAADGLPVPGVSVAFAATVGGGGVVASAVTTDSVGVARTFVRLGTGAGGHSYTATVAGVAPVTFTATAHAGAPVVIARHSGIAQSDTAGKTLAQPFVVRIIDASANPVAGAAVAWHRRVGDGSVSPDTSLSDSLGRASTSYTLGAPGTDTVRATLVGTSAFVEFHAISLPGVTVVTRTAGDVQTDTVGQPLADSLIVTLTDQATALPLAGRAVTWTVLSGNAVFSDDTVTTGVAGRAGIRVTLGQAAGPVSIQATTAGAVAPVTFAVTAVHGAPEHLAFVVAPPDTVAAGTVVAPAVVVELRDTFDNAVPQAGVAIRARMAGATTITGQDSLGTDSTGRATFDSLRLSGAVRNDELRFDAPALVAARKVVRLKAGAPYAMVRVAGDSQTAYLDSVVATRPRVQVVDAFVNPVPGASVEWVVVAGGGTLTGAVGPTDTLGEAAIGSWHLGAVAGPNRLRARIPGVDSAEFVATAEPLPPAITLTLRDTVVGTGRKVGLEIQLAEAAPTGGLTVTLTNSTPGVMTLDSASYAFAAGETIRVATLTGVTGGTTLLGATAPGYLADTLTVRGTSNVITVPTAFTVAYLNNGNLTVQLPAPAPTGGITVTVASLDTTKVTVLTPTVTFTAGQQNQTAQLRGVRPGHAAVVASAPGFLADTADVNSAATIDIFSGGGQAFTSIGYSFVASIRSNGVVVSAPPGGIVATLTARNPTCVVTDGSSTFLSGAATNDTAFAGTGPFPCQTYLVMSAPGLAPDSLLIQADSQPVIEAPAGTVNVGAGLQRPVVVFVNYTQHGGRTITARSLTPSKVLVQPNPTTAGSESVSQTIANGVGVPGTPFLLAGVEGATDTGAVVFEIPGFRPDTVQVVLRPPFIGFNGINVSRPTTAADVDVYGVTGISIGSSGITDLQAIRAGGTISRTATFRVKSAHGAVRFYDSTGVRDTVATAIIATGSGSTPPVFANGGVRLDYFAPGVDTITVALPGATTVGADVNQRIEVTPGTLVFTDATVQVGAGLFTLNHVAVNPLQGHSVSVGGPAHPDLQLTLRVLESGIALLQPDVTTIGADTITITVPAGTAAVKYFVAGLEGVLNDTVAVVVTSPGLVPDTVKVIVRQPALELQGVLSPVAVGTGARDIFAMIGLPDAGGTAVVTPQAIRPGSTLNRNVTFAWNAPSVAQLVDQVGAPGPIKVKEIQIGNEITPFRLFTGGVGLEPLAPGAGSVTVAMPGVLTVGTGTRAVVVTP